MSKRPENGQKLVEEVQKYKDWNLTVYHGPVRVLLIKKILFEEEMYKIRCLWTQLNFIEGLIEFMGFIWKKLKFWGQIIIFESWFGQIRDLIAYILKSGGQLGTRLKKSKTKDHSEKARKVKGWSEIELFLAPVFV